MYEIDFGFEKLIGFEPAPKKLKGFLLSIGFHFVV